MEEEKIRELGFCLIKQSNCNGYKTSRYKKGIIIVEITYKNEKLMLLEGCFDEREFFNLDVEKLKMIDTLLNKKI